MANGFNQVTLMGNLTADPELRYTPQGTAVTDLRMAINGPKDDTVFVDVTVWDKAAEACAKYLGKGRAALVSGRLRQDTWEDRETGQKRSKLAVTAFSVQFLGGGDGQSGDGGSASQQAKHIDRSAEANDVPF